MLEPVLGVIIGPAFYDTLYTIWNDAERSPEIRKEALLGMETANPQATCALCLEFLNSIQAVEHFPEEKIEIAALIFARNGFQAGLAPLERLQNMVQASSLTADEKQEHLGFLEEAVDVLKGPEA